MIRTHKSINMTQAEFSVSLGLAPTSASNWEKKVNSQIPTESMQILICEKFGINRNWLKTGDGEMFVSRTRDEEISEFIGDILRAEDDDFKKRLISQLAALDDSGWDILERCLDLVQYNKE